jgi:hypothetical protein
VNTRTTIVPTLRTPWRVRVHLNHAGQPTGVEIALQTPADARHHQLVDLVASLEPPE